MATGQAASAFGGLMSASDQKKAQVKKYKRDLEIQRVKWDGERGLYKTRVAEYKTEIQENGLKASRAYADEQSKLDDLFNEAAVKAQESFAQLSAKQKYFGSGKNAKRLEARDLKDFGRRQSLTVSNLVRARENYQGNVENIRERLRSSNRNAYSKVQFKPQPGFAPLKPNTDMTAATLQFVGGIASAASSGISSYNSLKAPNIKTDFFNPNVDFSSLMDFDFYGKVPSSFSFNKQ